MKILHVVPSIGPARGGPSFVLRTMARSQAKLGHEIHVATTDDNGIERLERANANSLIECGVEYRIFPRQTRFYTFSFPLTAWLWKHATDYDVIHIHALFSYPSIAAAVCARRARVPYVVRPLGVLNRWGMMHRRPWLKRLSFRIIESRIIRNSAAVQYTSEQESAEAAQLGVKHTSVILPNPVDLPERMPARGQFRSAYPILHSKTVVLFLSRIDVKKGIDLLLPAFSRLYARNRNAVLVVAGDGDQVLLEALKKQARVLGLEGAVLWAGFLQGTKKENAFADADLFVLPSYSENFGVAVVEAMGAGLPVIVSNQVGLHPDIERAEAGLVVECSEASLAEALRRLVEDAPLRIRMAANAHRLAWRFSPTEVAKELEQVYMTMLGNEVHELAI